MQTKFKLNNNNITSFQLLEKNCGKNVVQIYNVYLQFAKKPLLDGLYWETWYNNENVPNEQLGYIYYENKLLGVPRIRQLKVSTNSCQVHDDFKDVIRECFDSYSENLEDKTSEVSHANYTG